MKNAMLFILLSGMALYAGPQDTIDEKSEAKSMGTASKIMTKDIAYSAGGKTFIGYLAWDASRADRRPGILVVHEWLGLNEYAKRRARDLAAEGYAAFALDMYGDGKAIPMSEARGMSGKVGSDFPLIKERFNAALAVLKSQPFVDGNNLAAIGYCFGGGIVLNMARMGTTIKGVVSFHGSINTGLTAKPGDIVTKILAYQGDGDPAAPEEKRNAFIAEMDSSGADYEYVVFDNVKAHNFTNPDGSSYYEKESRLAWDGMIAFFNGLF